MEKLLCLTVPMVFILLSGKTIASHEKDEAILELSNDNFQEAINDHEYVLVNFYSPNCGHCETLAPEYLKAAKELHNDGSNVILARVDATKEAKLADKFGVDGYPTLKFFVKGIPTEYTGGRKAEEINKWVAKKTGPPAIVLKSLEQLNSLVESNTVVVVGFFSDLNGELSKAFIETARSKENILFAILNEQELFSEFNVTEDQVVLFKKFDEGKSYYDGPARVSDLTEFVQLNSVPLLIDFSYDFAPMIFSGSIKNHMLLFTSTQAENYPRLKEMFTKFAKEYKGKLLFIVVDSDKEELKTISHFFGVTEAEVPGVRIVSLLDEMKKYKSPKPSLEEEDVSLFIKQFLAGELKPDLLSEEIPEDWDHASVKTLVGKNFNLVVDQSDKSSLVMFYAPWCGHCKALEPLWNELGEHFKESKDVVIAKMDSTKNEIESFKIKAFPTIKLFSKGILNVKDYNGERTFEGVLKFVESDGMDGGAVDIYDDSFEDDETTGRDEL